MHKAHLKYKKTKLLNLGNPLDSPINNKYDFFIINPAYNEKQYLIQTLNSIDNQVNYYKLLVIVVINNQFFNFFVIRFFYPIYIYTTFFHSSEKCHLSF